MDSSKAWQSVPTDLLTQAEDGVGIALGVTEAARDTLGNGVVIQLQTDVFDAFMRGLSVGCVVAGAVTLLGAAAAARFLPARPVASSVNVLLPLEKS